MMSIACSVQCIDSVNVCTYELRGQQLRGLDVLLEGLG